MRNPWTWPGLLLSHPKAGNQVIKYPQDQYDPVQNSRQQQDHMQLGEKFLRRGLVLDDPDNIQHVGSQETYQDNY